MMGLLHDISIVKKSAYIDYNDNSSSENREDQLSASPGHWRMLDTKKERAAAPSLTGRSHCTFLTYRRFPET